MLGRGTAGSSNETTIPLCTARVAPNATSENCAAKAATDDQRSLASYVERLLIGHLKAKGYLSVEQPRTDRIAHGASHARRMADFAIDKVLQHSTELASVQRDRRRALTEMPARVVVKDRRRK